MRDIALTVVFFGLLPLAFFRPWIAVLMWYWIGIMNPHRLAFGFAYTFPYAQLVALAMLGGLMLTKDRKGPAWSPEILLMLVLLAHFTVTTTMAWAPPQAWDQWDRVIKTVLMTVVATTLVYGREKIRWLMLVVALSVGFYGFKGGVFTLLTGGGERVQGPPDSPFAGNTFIGLALAMVVPLLVALAREECNKRWKTALYVTSWMSVLSSIFTYSRGALLGLGVVIPMMLWKAKRKVLVLSILIPVAIVGAAVAPDKLFKRADTIAEYQEDESAMERIQSWIVAWNIAADHPLTGAGFSFESSPDRGRWYSYGGPDVFKYMDKPLVAHSIYFQYLGQHGWVGLILFLTLLGMTLRRMRLLSRETRDDPELAWIASYCDALRIGLFGYMVSGAFLSLGYFDLIWVYIALTAIMRRELAEARAARAAAAGRQPAESPALVLPRGAAPGPAVAPLPVPAPARGATPAQGRGAPLQSAWARFLPSLTPPAEPSEPAARPPDRRTPIRERNATTPP